MNESFEERFWEKVDKAGVDECWEWNAGTIPTGYGMIYYNGRNRLSHRIVVRLSGGEIPEDKQVNHKCDNPSCVNPNHLYIGTQSDNIQDAFDRGRKESPKIPNAKLSEEDVAEIKAREDEDAAILSAEFGVAKTTIYNILNGVTWSDVPPNEV